MKLHHSVLWIIGVLLLLTVAIGQQPDPSVQSPPKEQPGSSSDGEVSDSDDLTSKDALNVQEPSKQSDRIAAALLLVKSDWSDHEDAKAIEGDLKRLLKDAALPELYRGNLLYFAPRILFSDEFVSLYDADEFTSLLVWLMENELARVEGQPSRPDIANEKEYEQAKGSDNDNDFRVATMLVSDNVVPVKIAFGSQLPSPPPFVTYEYYWNVTFTSRHKASTGDGPPVLEVDMARLAQRIDTVRVSYSKTVETKNLGGTERMAFDFPAHQVAVAQFTFDQSDRYRDTVRTDGWEPVIYMTREDLPESRNVKPALAKPATLFKPSTSSRNRFFPPAPRGTTARYYSPGGRGGASSGGLGSSPKPAPKNEPEPQMIKVFALQFVEAEATGQVLKQLLPTQNIAVDVETNSIITRGEQKALSEIEALLEMLDRQATNQVKPIGGQQSSNNPAIAQALLETLRNKFESTEKQTKSIANELLNEEDEQATQRLRNQLTIVVTEAFGLRQELQKAELNLLQERIRHIESQIEQRETLRNEIIRQRVEQLVSNAASGESSGRTGGIPTRKPEPKTFDMNFERTSWPQVLEWYAEQRGVAFDYQEEISGAFSYRSPRPHTLEEVHAAIAGALPKEFELVLNEGQLIIRRRDLRNATPAQSITTVIRPADFRSETERLKKSIAEFEGFRHALKQQGAANNRYDDSIARAKQRLSLLRAEYETQVKLLELEVTGGKAAENSTKQELDLAKALFASGVLSSSDMNKATNAYEQARVRHAQASALLELYRKVDTSEDSASNNKPNAVVKVDSESSEEPGDVRIEALPDQGVIILRGAKDDVEDVEETLKQLGNNRNESAKEPAPAP